MKRPNPEMIDDENPEWTEEDFRNAMNFSEIHEVVKQHFRGKQKKPLKIPTTIRLSENVIEHFKKTGKGWQTRIDEALVELVKQREAA
ncbi:MAG: BrnA antitoxin family protein [Bacteroides sp.]|nr:BrnA antitoxin family protein [Bacteroides sp.]